MEPDHDVEDTNPQTFYDIQEETTWTIMGLVLIVNVLYISFFLMIWGLILFYLNYESDGMLELSLFGPVGQIAVVIGVGSACVHAFVAYFRDLEGELRKIGAEEIDPDDRYHRVFDNVLDEMRIAADRSDVEGYVLPSKYRTALSLAGRNRSAVVLTEGAISSLDRSELQSVVAHEFAHIAYGDTKAKTFLQNIVSSLDDLTDTLSERGGSDDHSFYTLSYRESDGGELVAYLLLLLVTTLYETVTRVLSTTISKQREWRADATAVEFTRNPEALASALYKIGFFYDKNTVKMPKYVSHSRLTRRNYESLQLVPVSAERYENDGGWFDQLFNTHPPLRKRINKLLDMVRVSFQDLKSSVTAVDPTEDYVSQPVQMPDGTPLQEQECWVERDGQVNGPMPIVQLFTGGMLDGDARIRLSSSGPLKPLSAFPFFQEVQKRGTTGDQNGGCPDCGGVLREDEYLGAPIDACAVCGGVGTEIKHLARIICRYRADEDEEQEVRLNLDQFNESPHPTEQPEEQRELQGTCPECDREFNKSFYTGRTSLIVDVCSVCGYLWFEHREFQIACRLSTT